MKQMQIGVISLGRVDGKISRRLMKAGHQCVVFDANASPREVLTKEGVTAAGSAEAVVETLGETPRSIRLEAQASAVTGSNENDGFVKAMRPFILRSAAV